MTAPALTRLLPVAPRPQANERLTSWLARLAALYGAPAGALLAHCGLGGVDPFALEKGLGAGQGALLAERTGISLSDLEAMTFGELAAPAHSMIARGDRATCPLCAERPAVKRKDAALPWSFWCSTHGSRRRPLAGAAIDTLFGAVLAELDPLARQGARRLADWAVGGDEAAPSAADLVAFLATPHRRPSPPSLREQPRLSLAARRAYRGFLAFPIARQALLVVVPEYDRVAPPLAKPVRPGLLGLANGSLLQRYALAVGLGRMTLAPVECAAAALAGGDEEGRERLRAALQAWPAGLRRRVYARLRVLVAERASAGGRGTGSRPFSHRPVSQTPARVSSIPVRVVSGTPTRNLTNSAPNRRAGP